MRIARPGVWGRPVSARRVGASPQAGLLLTVIIFVTADQTEINAAITALPATGGEVLDGTYNIAAKIDVTKDNVSIGKAMPLY